MAIIRFNLNSQANHQSTKSSDWLDTVKDLGLDEGEWEEMDEDDKLKIVEEWANNYLEIYYEER